MMTPATLGKGVEFSGGCPLNKGGGADFLSSQVLDKARR